MEGFFSGLPKAITQTPDGYLWIGTTTGLVRFDGVRFTPWAPPAGKRLPSSEIRSLLSARDGSLWIGTAAGLSHFVNPDLINYTDQAFVESIVEDSNGTVWFTRMPIDGDGGPLCQVIGGTGTRCYGKNDGIPASCGGGGPLAQDNSGNLWIGCNTGVVEWKQGAFRTYPIRELQSSLGLTAVKAFLVRADGSLLVASNRTLQELAEGRWRQIGFPGLDAKSLEVNFLFLDHEHALWIGTPNQGIFRLSGGSVDRFRFADGLSSDDVFQFYEDREGGLWTVTDQGIDCFRDAKAVSFSAHEGLPPGLYSLVAARDDTLWIGGSESLSAFRRDRVVVSIQTPKDFGGPTVTALFEDHSGQLWVGVGNTLTIYRNGKFDRITRQDGQQVGLTLSVTEDTENNIWALTIGTSSRQRLICIRHRRILSEVEAPELPPARTLAPDPRGGIWLGLSNGDLARYRDGRIQTFHSNDTPQTIVHQVMVNADGSVFGGTSLGLIVLRNGNRRMLTSRNGLPCDDADSFISDNDNTAWLNMSCALVGIESAELQRWWEHPSTTVQFRILETLDGMREGGSRGFLNAAKTTDGRLWFAGSHVLQMVDPTHLTKNAPIAPVHVEEIVADRKKYAAQEGLRIPPLTRDLEIDYTALSFTVPQRVRFRYKLEGRDKDWQEPGTRRQAFYTDLRPANYKFRVIACNSDGVWNEAGASLDFSVVPTYYQTAWFRLSCVAAFLALLVALYRLRLRQLERQFEMRMQERVNERTRIARELHDTLLQSFHGALFRFQAVRNMLPKRPERAMEALDGAILRTEQAIAEGRGAIKDLRDESTAQGDLADLLTTTGQELAAPRGEPSDSPVFSVVVEGERRTLSPILQDEVYRIGREVLRNAFHHANARHIEAEIRYDNQFFRLRIRDDGKGVDPKILQDRSRVGHWGLPGVHERSKRIGAQLDFWTEAGAGTEVQLSVPAATAYKTSQKGLRFGVFRTVKSNEQRS